MELAASSVDIQLGDNRANERSEYLDPSTRDGPEVARQQVDGAALEG